MKKLSVRVGDIFAVPVHVETGHHGFVLGRVISEESFAHLIEIFETMFEDVPKHVDLSMTKTRLFRPVFMKFLFTKIPKWQVIQRNPSFDKKEADYENIEIAFEHSLPPQIWEQGKTRVAKPGEIDGLEPSIVWFPERITRRIAAHLMGDLGPNDTCPDRVILAQENATRPNPHPPRSLRTPDPLSNVERREPNLGKSGQAVIVSFEYGSTDLTSLYEVEDQIEEILRKRGVGEFDGHDIAIDGSDGHLYIYGPDADALFEAVRPVLYGAECFNNIIATLQYGSLLEDDNTREAEITVR